MKTFKYSALSDGERVTGVIEALDEYVAAERIKTEYPVILKLTEIKRKESIFNKNLTSLFDAKTLALISSEMGTVLSAGIDVATAIELIAGDVKNKKTRRMLLNTAKDVEEGNSLAISFEKNCEKIPPTFVESVRAGELTGNLDETFATMEKYYDRSYKIQEKIRQAMIYPVFVIVVAIVVLSIVMVKVIPTLTSVFDQYDGELPGITVQLMKFGDFFSHWWGLLAFLVIAIIIGIKIFSHTTKGRPVMAQIELKRPVMGKISIATTCADISITLEMLLRAGIPLTEALDITARSIKNFIFQKEIRSFKSQVENGSRLGELMTRSKVIPEVLAQMVSIGEETGDMETMLKKTGDYYSNEAQHRIKKALAKLEPAILVVLALFAGFIVMALYLPMFTMYDFM